MATSRESHSNPEVAEALEKLGSIVIDVEMASYKCADADNAWALMSAIDQKIEHADFSNQAIWTGIRNSLQAKIDDAALWLSETGGWIAVATRWTAETSDRDSMIGEAVEMVECKGRMNAVKSARSLRAKYADDYESLSWVDVEIMPAKSERAHDLKDWGA